MSNTYLLQQYWDMQKIKMKKKIHTEFIMMKIIISSYCIFLI